MSLLGTFRADQQINALISEQDPESANARKLSAKLKNSGPKSIPKIIDALALSDKTHTMMFVDILSALVSDKSIEYFREGLADGNERVVSGTAWALSSSTDYNANKLLEFFDDPEVSKPALIEILRVHKDDLSVHELMQRAYELDTKDKAALFRIIEDMVRVEMLPDLIARMGGKDPIVKIHLINLLAKYDRTEVNRALEGQLRDNNKMVRSAALSALGNRKGGINIEAVARLLQDPDLDVMNKAVEMLIQINHPDTTKHLAGALKDESE